MEYKITDEIVEAVIDSHGAELKNLKEIIYQLDNKIKSLEMAVAIKTYEE